MFLKFLKIKNRLSSLFYPNQKKTMNDKYKYKYIHTHCYPNFRNIRNRTSLPVDITAFEGVPKMI